MSAEDGGPFSWTRRRFGQGALAALAGAALPGCADSPPEAIVPYVDRPPGLIPGRPRFYATSVPREGYGMGLLARSREGRPVKLEGNPAHPASLGGSSALEQALLYSLYDEGRLRGTSGPAGATGFGSLARALGGRDWGRGRGLAFLLEPSTCPLLAAQLEALAEALPEARVDFGPSAAAARLAASERVYGEALERSVDASAAALLLSVGGDPLVEGPEALRLARQLGPRRGRTDPEPRLYAAETALSLTGAYADVRLALAPSALGRLPGELLAALGRRGLPLPEPLRGPLAAFEELPEGRRAFVEGLAAELLAKRGRAAILVGEQAPVALQVACLGLAALVGEGTLRPSPLWGWRGAEGLLGALEAGEIEALVVEGNPLAAEPPQGAWSRALGRPGLRVTLSDYLDEAAALAQWRVARAHPLERWGALRAADGSLGTTQPLIEPLRGGRTVTALLGLFLGDHRGDRARLRAALAGGELFEATLERGLLPGSEAAPVAREPAWTAVAEALSALAAEGRPEGLELCFAQDWRVGEGARASNAWLRELPNPITRLSWENAALIAPATARAQGVEAGALVRLERGGVAVELPALVQPGQAEGSVVLWPGYGRAGGGPLAELGFDVRALRAAEGAAALTLTGKQHLLAQAQVVSSQGGLEIARRRALEAPARPREPVPPSLHPSRVGAGPQWGMVIDLAACTGCGSCVVACQAENNIPTVGKVQVALGRAMHWLRVDRYYEAHSEGTRVSMQPMACQHCEKAPCEYVCPTAATNHSADGLNQMVYNRCVGTRFCSNNCPYKVRRFNYYDYHRGAGALEALRANPEVSVRARGVMEKCSYCVQRLRAAEGDARRAGRTLRDGNARVACQQACPSVAIAFGLISDEESEVSRWRASPRAYGALAELGVRPRTRYLERIDRPPGAAR